MSQTILITGASSGIGKASATLFADRGWNVVATMRNTDDGADLADRDNVLVAALDLLDSESITAAVADGIERFGTIDVLLNNAGYGAYGPLEATPMSVLRRQFDVNVFGLVETIQAVLPSMRAQRSGVIINISSVEGKMGKPGIATYVTAKHAVNGLTKAMALEVGPIGITVNALCPGAIETDMMIEEGAKAAESMGMKYEDLLNWFASESSIKRLNDVEDVALVASLLVSEAGAGITGSLISIDGGTSPY